MWGQSTAARISGVITDATGAVVPGAGAAAVNVETGQKIAGTSNHYGQYVLYPLPAGTYRLDFEKQGFRGYRIEQLQVYANDDVGRNVRLEVGMTSQEVTVSS